MTNFRPGYLEQGQPLGMTYNQVLLTADNQNSASTIRTFTLTPSTQVGATLLLYFYTVGSHANHVLQRTINPEQSIHSA